MTLEEITRDFDALTEEDFDFDKSYGRGGVQLYSICEAIRLLPDPEQATDAMFEVMERLSAVRLGSPGPLVHTLETFPNYQASLFASFQRKPTPLTAWMINRILNSTHAEGERKRFMGLLEQVASHPLADEETKETVADYLAYQADY